MTTLRLTGMETSHQGSGALLGERQFFVRFAGCSVKGCPIRNDCDEPFSLDRLNGFEREPQEVVDRAVDEVGTGGWLHITGGEPTDQAEGLARLIQLARRERLRIHLQTAGLTQVDLPCDWITVSPKVPARKLHQRKGSELIVVFDGQEAEVLRDYEQTSFWHYFLQPMWVGEKAANTQATVAAAHALGSDWRITLQAHKYLNVY